MVRPWLATDKVRFVGEPVVAVLTEQAYQGQDAADLVEVDYDPLPAVVDLRAAALATRCWCSRRSAPTPTNGFGLDEEFDEHLFDDCEVVVTREIVNQRLAACAAGDPGRRGGLGRRRAGHAVVLHPERAERPRRGRRLARRRRRRWCT